MKEMVGVSLVEDVICVEGLVTDSPTFPCRARFVRREALDGRPKHVPIGEPIRHV